MSARPTGYQGISPKAQVRAIDRSRCDAEILSPVTSSNTTGARNIAFIKNRLHRFAMYVRELSVWPGEMCYRAEATGQSSIAVSDFVFRLCERHSAKSHVIHRVSADLVVQADDSFDIAPIKELDRRVCEPLAAKAGNFCKIGCPHNARAHEKTRRNASFGQDLGSFQAAFQSIVKTYRQIWAVDLLIPYSRHCLRVADDLVTLTQPRDQILEISRFVLEHMMEYQELHPRRTWQRRLFPNRPAESVEGQMPHSVAKRRPP
jgi:hypothetical protein